jgi:hypothetical protein
VNRSDKTSAFIIRRMIDLLDQQGWCQHVMAQDQDGAPCYVEDRQAWSFGLVGALYWTIEKYPLMSKYKEGAIAAILRSLNKRKSAEGKLKSPSDIIKDRDAKSDAWKFHFNKFNDEPGRVKSEIVKMLREAMED